MIYVCTKSYNSYLLTQLTNIYIYIISINIQICYLVIVFKFYNMRPSNYLIMICIDIPNMNMNECVVVCMWKSCSKLTACWLSNKYV